jgi:hypothetical protein
MLTVTPPVKADSPKSIPYGQGVLLTGGARLNDQAGPALIAADGCGRRRLVSGGFAKPIASQELGCAAAGRLGRRRPFGTTTGEKIG